METGYSVRGSKPGRAAFGAAALGGIAVAAAVIAWTLPKGVAASDRINARVEVASRATVKEANRSAEPATNPAALAEEQAKSRKPLCAECGIIEAVQRIEAPLAFTGWCDATEIARARNSGRAYGRDFRVDRETLRDTVAAAIAESRNTTKEAVTTTHRIVVRMRNGSRRVFDESTPRMVNVGDRMVVIAGAPRANG